MAKLLFLAQFAPTEGKPVETRTPEEEFYSQTYHQKIYDILCKYGYDFHSTSDVNFLINHHHKFDLVWSVYNRLGFRNSEIFVQSLCEYFGLKYIGATPNIRALVEDKSLSKQLAIHLGIKTADWVVASKQSPLSTSCPFEGPYFIKPRFGSASIGIDESCLCLNWDAVLKKAGRYFEDSIDVIIEKFIDGRYYGVPLMNTIEQSILVATPHCQLSKKIGNIITHKQKRFTEPGMIRKMSRNKDVNKMLTYFATKYYTNMQPCDYARVDFIVDRKTGIPYFLEVNTLMNLGTKSGFIASFLDKNFKDRFENYDDIINHIINLGFSKINGN